MPKEVPHDYGDPAAIEAQHKFTTDQAAKWEAARVAAIKKQQESDAWRGQGPVTPWGKLSQREVPHDYGDPAAIEAQHKFTMDQAAGLESQRVAAVSA